MKDYDKNGKLKSSASKREEANMCQRCPKDKKSDKREESDSESENSNESDDSSYEDFGSTEEIMATTKENKKEPQALSAKMIISILIEVGSKKYRNCLLLVDSGASDDLANEEIVSSRSGIEQQSNSV